MRKRRTIQNSDLLYPFFSTRNSQIKWRDHVLGEKVRIEERRVCTAACTYVMCKAFITSDCPDMVSIVNYSDYFLQWEKEQLLARAEYYLKFGDIQVNVIVAPRSDVIGFLNDFSSLVSSLNLSWSVYIFLSHFS
uniref:Uncharacterized protein n=1 Tax=Photinus pyralis TaxID=7054 RepID=A0A1Y1LU35_PHOPY